MYRGSRARTGEERVASASASSASHGLVMLCDVDLEASDGTRSHTLGVAAGFAGEGLDVDLIARGPDPGLEGVRYHGAGGAEHERVRRVGSINALTIGLLWKRRRSAGRLYVRHSWSNMLVLIAGRVLGYRVVTQVDDVPYGRGYGPDLPFVVDHVKRLTAMLMGRLAHGVVAVTPEIRGLLTDEFRVPPERVLALRNGVDVDFFRPLPRAQAIERAGLDPGLSYVVFSGRFQPWVDFELMLGAFAIVAHRRPDARLILIGDGGEREAVEGIVGRLGIGEAVQITGLIGERERVRDLVCAGTVALAAHREEYVGHIGVSPTKLAEYFAVGRAVVAKDVPGIRATVEETGAGVVVPGDPDAMAEAILALLDDPGRAEEHGEIGRRVAEERYTWRSVVRRTLPLFGR
jgi:glycosyltransferase involved in cell wall biosynthesis